MALTPRIVIEAQDKTGGAFRAVGAKARELQGQIDQVGRGFAGFGATLTTALSGFGIGAFVQHTVDGLLAIKDLSEATGASIANISALEDVTRRAGMQFDDARSVLLKFNMALKDSERTKELGAALRAIGLDADKLRQMDPAEALLETAKALDQFADDGNKARLQAELFGRNVATAAPLLKELAEAGQLNATVTQEQVLRPTGSTRSSPSSARTRPTPRVPLPARWRRSTTCSTPISGKDSGHSLIQVLALMGSRPRRSAPSKSTNCCRWRVERITAQADRPRTRRTRRARKELEDIDARARVIAASLNAANDAVLKIGAGCSGASHRTRAEAV